LTFPRKLKGRKNVITSVYYNKSQHIIVQVVFFLYVIEQMSIDALFKTKIPFENLDIVQSTQPVKQLSNICNILHGVFLTWLFVHTYSKSHMLAWMIASSSKVDRKFFKPFDTQSSRVECVYYGKWKITIIIFDLFLF
jgi:hypothetical protein